MRLVRPSSRSWPRWLAVGLGCGGLIALSLPPFGWWPLAWLGVSGIALALPGRGFRSRLILGFAVGMGQYVIGLWWVQQFTFYGCIALMILFALFDAVALSLVPTRTRWGVSLALPAVLVLADAARDRFPFGGVPIADISMGQANSPLAPVVRLGGSLALTFETAVIGVGVAWLIDTGLRWWSGRSSWDRAPNRRRGVRSGVILAAVFLAVAVAVGGVARVAPSGLGGHMPSLRVALVQGGGTRGTRAVHTNPQVVFQRDLAASQVLAPPLNLVVWPEGAMQSDPPFTQTVNAEAVQQLAISVGATVVAGVEQDVGTTHYLNEVVAWGPDGSIVASYTKQHLVPFGEYVPFRSVLQKFFNISDVPLDAIPGRRPGILRTPAGPLGVMVSFEVLFDRLARDAVRAGGQVLLVPTNTASYRGTQVVTQELASSRLRALETGRWLLQVTPTGYTAVVSPSGRVVERTSLNQQRVLDAIVPLEDGRTIYVDIGDVPMIVLAFVLLLAAWGFDRRARNETVFRIRR